MCTHTNNIFIVVAQLAFGYNGNAMVCVLLLQEEILQLVSPPAAHVEQVRSACLLAYCFLACSRLFFVGVYML